MTSPNVSRSSMSGPVLSLAASTHADDRHTERRAAPVPRDPAESTTVIATMVEGILSSHSLVLSRGASTTILGGQGENRTHSAKRQQFYRLPRLSNFAACPWIGGSVF